ncbi:pectate lyase family protein [Coralloluteibacterium stylophorae]|uniref:Pectate lyase n=1 Tax=Coralloluteibacterium stylophorae TaxID=1776034 RepID=A0A8J7VR06_9GAMM|nr:hypothetical protein [Coralloluteibacterium stylophorae]MBS7458172.1 hypothetical protein [Coralloluteibacterium stylophorae]
MILRRLALPALALGLLFAALPAVAAAQWAQTDGGRGGRIVRVTTLAADGPGSLRAALAERGRRIVVFEVGGVIDLDRKGITITEPEVTVAGQTAPSPGITLIRGGIGVRTHDVIVQHLHIRPGDAGAARGEWESDGLSASGAHDVVFDHNSLTWAIDENGSASGPRFDGGGPADWREATSHRITFSNNLIAEALAHATHAKGEHSKGVLVHDNATGILMTGNLFAHNFERNPLFKGGVHGAVLNNLIYNPGQRAIHYNLIAWEWEGEDYQDGVMDIRGNVLRGGMDTAEGLPLLTFGGSGDLRAHLADNIAVDRFGQPLPTSGRYTTGPARLVETDTGMDLPRGFALRPAAEVEEAVLAEAGARPWDRDPHDIRIIADVVEGRGRILDSQDQVGGYPAYEETRRAFDPADWDLDTLTPKGGFDDHG